MDTDGLWIRDNIEWSEGPDREIVTVMELWENRKEWGLATGHTGNPGAVNSWSEKIRQHPAILEHEIEFKRARLPGDKNKTAIAIGLKLRDGARSSAGHFRSCLTSKIFECFQLSGRHGRLGRHKVRTHM